MTTWPRPATIVSGVPEKLVIVSRLAGHAEPALPAVAVAEVRRMGWGSGLATVRRNGVGMPGTNPPTDPLRVKACPGAELLSDPARANCRPPRTPTAATAARPATMAYFRISRHPPLNS